MWTLILRLLIDFNKDQIVQRGGSPFQNNLWSSTLFSFLSSLPLRY